MSDVRDEVNRHSRLYQYRRDRRDFAWRVYSLAALFVAIAILQWCLILLISSFSSAIENHFYISIIGLLLALVTVTAFIFFENVRFIYPVNWILALCIIEGITFGLARAVAEAQFTFFVMCLASVIIVMVLFVTLGVLMSHDLTLDVVILFVCSVVFFIGSVFFVMMHILAGVSYSLYIYCSFVILTILLFIMYHGQTINGGRYAEMRLNDYLLAALILFHDFAILFILSFYLISKMSEKLGGVTFNVYCEQCNTVSGGGGGSTTTTTASPSDLLAHSIQFSSVAFSPVSSEHPTVSEPSETTTTKAETDLVTVEETTKFALPMTTIILW